MEIVKAQASVRTMTEDDIISMVKSLRGAIKSVFEPSAGGPEMQDALMDPKKAIKEKSIICLESASRSRSMTRKHLAKFGLTPDQYREKLGYPKKMPLVCKALQRERRKKMKDMKLWEKRVGKKADAPAAADEASPRPRNPDPQEVGPAS